MGSKGLLGRLTRTDDSLEVARIGAGAIGVFWMSRGGNS